MPRLTAMVISSSVWLLWSSPMVRAQEGTALVTPARVRVVAPPLVPTPTIATATGHRADSLVLQVSRSSTMVVPVASIQSLEISQGKRRKTATGALVGALVGGAATALFLSGFCSDPDSACQADEVARAVVIIAVPPTVLGALVGAVIWTERWDRLPLERLDLRNRGTPILRMGLRLPL
jgi:hypothetical protein